MRIISREVKEPKEREERGREKKCHKEREYELERDSVR